MIKIFKLNIIDILEKNRRTLFHLQKEKVSYALFAGAAATFYGVQREIRDLDIVFPENQREIIKESFYNFYLKQKDDSDFSLSFKNLELIEGNLKYMIKGNEYQFTFDDEMIAKRKIFRWGNNNNNVFFMSPEDTIVLKVILQRDFGGINYDIEDIVTILQHNRIDINYLSRRLKKSKVEQEFRRLFPILKKRVSNFSEILKYE